MSAIQESIATVDTTKGSAGPMPAKRKWEAADTVIALAGGLVLIIFGIFAFLCWQGYANAIQTAKTRAQTSADIVATQAAWLLGGGLTSLRLIEAKLAFEPAVLDPVEKTDLDQALQALPTGASLALYDPSGAVLPNGGSPALPANISDTPYFAEVTSGGLLETVAPQDADASTGAPLIVLARRLGGDTLAGVAVLAIPGTAMDDFWVAQSMPPGSTISIIRNDGFVVARYPALPQTINLAETSPFWPDIANNDRGTYESGRSPADGISRIVGYAHLRDLRIVGIGSVSTDAVLAGLWKGIITVLWLMGPIAVALFGGSLLTARLLRQSTRTQRTLAAAVAHNEVLFREIHHRVKNNLQSVASLLQMQPIPREIKANMGQRIAAMSAVHEHIYRSNDFETVRVRDYLQTLIASMRAGHDPRIEVVEQFDDLSVDRDNATPLGLIVNEVVSNAFKHAFPDGQDGRITVTLTRIDDGRGRLTIEDNGVGYDPATPAKGIGQRLIKALTLQIAGESKIDSTPGSGSRFVLEFPLAQVPMG